MSDVREVIDVDDLDVLCTGVRYNVYVHRPPSPRPRKRPRDPVTISLVDSDAETHSPSLSAVDHRTQLQRLTQAELASRSAARPFKKRAADAMRIAADVAYAHNDRFKRKNNVQDVIEISSDSEPGTPPPKRQKIKDHFPDHSEDMLQPSVNHPPEPSPSDQGPSSSDDDSSIDLLDSLDISNEANWVPLPERNKAEDLTPTQESDSDLAKPLPIPSFRLPRKMVRVDQCHISREWSLRGPWGILSRNFGITRFPKPFYHAQRREHLFPHRPPNLHCEKGYSKLGLTAKYPHLGSGCKYLINKVIQKQGSVVLGTVVEGGWEDDDDDDDDAPPPPPPENRPGSLVVYRHGRVHVAPAHRRMRKTSRGSTMKYYSVHDVAFNPLDPRQFLSSGQDRAVQTWAILDDQDDSGECKGLESMRTFDFDSRPQDLVYSPDGLALAITCYDGTVQLYSHDLFADMMDGFSPPKRLYAAPKGSGHATGCTLWGDGPSQHLLFTSSEPTDKDDYGGFHHAFDARRGVQAVQFDAIESGDAATLSPDGTTLVLFTWSKNHTHPVRLYDVRRKLKEAYETEELEKFRMRPHAGSNRCLGDSEEVNHASFSPDGRLLAIARNDNALHIYDVRVLSRGPLCRFEHHELDAVGGGGFGVVRAQWIQGRHRIGLASGGNDGCVRLWEPGLASRSDVQGTVIGRSDFEICDFSIGDRQNGELPLVIGDSGGGMHTYDFTNTDGISI